MAEMAVAMARSTYRRVWTMAAMARARVAARVAAPPPGASVVGS